MLSMLSNILQERRQWWVGGLIGRCPSSPADEFGTVLQRSVRLGCVLEVLQTSREEFQKDLSASRPLHCVSAVRTVITCLLLDSVPASTIEAQDRRQTPGGSTFQRTGIHSRARPPSFQDPPGLLLPWRREEHATSVCQLRDRLSGWMKTRCATRLSDTVTGQPSYSAPMAPMRCACPCEPAHRILHAERSVLPATKEPALPRGCLSEKSTLGLPFMDSPSRLSWSTFRETSRGVAEAVIGREPGRLDASDDDVSRLSVLSKPLRELILSSLDGCVRRPRRRWPRKRAKCNVHLSLGREHAAGMLSAAESPMDRERAHDAADPRRVYLSKPFLSLP